jgi:conjugative transfer signal peptidase TraF
MRDDQTVPPPRWEPPLARERRARSRRRRPFLIAAGFGIAMLGAGFARDHRPRSAPRIVWNASASAPIGLWRAHPGTSPKVGDMVLAETPVTVRRLAAERQYIPLTVPLIKRVAAGPGDMVCAFGSRISIDGRSVATRMRTDPQERPLPWWTGCERLAAGRFFLLNAPLNSFDSRYFGPVGRSAILGTVTPLWLR